MSRYQKRISGPLLDRVDIFVEVPRVEYEKLAADSLGEPSAASRNCRTWPEDGWTVTARQAGAWAARRMRCWQARRRACWPSQCWGRCRSGGGALGSGAAT